MDPEYIRAQLAKCGYTDISDDLLHEFITRLEKEGDVTSIKIISHRFPPRRLKRSASAGSRSSKRNQQTKKKRSPSSPLRNPRRQSQSKSSKATSPAKEETETTTTIVSHNFNDPEISQWTAKLKILRSRGNSLSSRIQKLRSSLHSTNDYVDCPVSFGKTRNKYDPYPIVHRGITGGFIRPPPIRSSRRRKLKIGPEYIPPPERRRDDYRWKIRQKLIYSDPRYRRKV